MDGRIVRCGIISLCQSAATFEIVKALLVTSPNCVRNAIASTGPVPFTFFALLEWVSKYAVLQLKVAKTVAVQFRRRR